MRFAFPPCLVLALGAAVFPASGQTAPVPTATAPAAAETVKLQPFEVSAQSVNGYAASESTTGTRVATKIADLPFVVNVVTSKFLNDFDFFDITSGLAYTSSLSAVDAEGNFNLRGFTSTFLEWNGFYRLGIVDRVNIDRIEIIKGPNAGIYGSTLPGGLVNFITKTPTAVPYEDVRLTRGSFDLTRLEGNINTPLGSIGGIQVGNLLNFAGTDRLFDARYAYLHERSLSDALKLTLNDHSSFLVQGEWGKRLSNTGDNTEPFIFNSKTGLFTGQLAPYNLARFSQGGPLEVQNRELTSINTEYENRLSDVWSVRWGSYGYDRHNSQIYNGTSNEFDPSLGEIVGISAKQARIRLNEDGGASQADILAHYFTFNHAVENKTLFTIDWSENWRFRLESQLPSTLNTMPTVQLINNPNYNFLPRQDLFTVVTRNDKVRWDTEGFFLREQATMLDDRLILFAGLRHDQVTYNLNFGNQYTTKAPFGINTPGQVEHFVNSAWTPTSGVNFKITKEVAFYGSYSQSFQPSAQVAKLGDPPLGNTRASGVDYGLKSNFLDDRLVFTVGGYYITENGIKITALDPVSGLKETVPGGSQNSRGVESDFTYQVTSNLSLLGGYGLVNARLLKEGTNTNADGKRPPNIPVDNGGLALSYTFKSIGLPGLSCHAGLTYTGVSYPETTASDVLESRIRLPAYETVEVGLAYTWAPRIGSQKFGSTLRFSMDNALNADAVDVKLNPVASRGFYLAYELKH